MIKKSVLEKIDTENVSYNTIIKNEKNKHEFRFIDQKEFEYQGCMYDVFKKEKKENGDVILYCIKDEKEFRLISIFNKMNKKQDTSKNRTSKNILKFLNSPYILPEHSFSYISITKNVLFVSCMNPLINLCREIPVPPPKLSNTKTFI